LAETLGLTLEEALVHLGAATREVMNMARRIAVILLLEPALDANYRAVTAETWDWGSSYGWETRSHDKVRDHHLLE
jgi:hypothetical protein